jgi:hypothetical protein
MKVLRSRLLILATRSRIAKISRVMLESRDDPILRKLGRHFSESVE